MVNKEFTDEQIKDNLKHYHAVLQGETADLSELAKIDLFRENPFPHHAAGKAINIKDGATTEEILKLCKCTKTLWKDKKKQNRNTLRFIEKYEAAEKAEKAVLVERSDNAGASRVDDALVAIAGSVVASNENVNTLTGAVRRRMTI